MLRLIKLWLKAPIEERDGDGRRRIVGGKREQARHAAGRCREPGEMGNGVMAIGPQLPRPSFDSTTSAEWRRKTNDSFARKLTLRSMEKNDHLWGVSRHPARSEPGLRWQLH